MPIKEIARFSVNYLQIMDEEGNVDKELDPRLPPDQCIRLYRAMVLAREGDNRMLNLQRQGRVGTFGMCVGQEGIACATALAMNPTDWFVGAYRELGGRLMRGETLLNPLEIFGGMEDGNVIPSTHPATTTPIAIIIASQLLHAVGVAYALKHKKVKDTAVVTFCGDGATSEGDFHEALNFASVWQAPVVFMVQNNHWAISIPRSKQTHSRTLAQKAIAYDIPTIQIDGNDPLAVYKTVGEALSRAKQGMGPTFIEAITYRLLMHTTADDPTRYRKDEEVQEWWKKEPLVRFKKYIEKRGIWDDAKQKALDEEIKAEIDAAVKAYESLPPVRPDAPFDHVFGTKHALIEEQRAQFLADLKLEASNG